LESLLSGVPVIVPNVGGIPEFVNETNGVLFDAGDEKGLTNAFEQWFATKSNFDASAIRRDIQAKFGKQAVANQLTEIYQNILSRC
jgi:glycosyltransferase involved in cell wall biosynthesis